MPFIENVIFCSLSVVLNVFLFFSQLQLVRKLSPIRIQTLSLAATTQALIRKFWLVVRNSGTDWKARTMSRAWTTEPGRRISPNWNANVGQCRSMTFVYNLLKRHNIYISSIVKLTLIWCSPVNVISRNKKKKYSDSILIIILRVYIDCYCTFGLHEFCIFIVRGIII